MDRREFSAGAACVIGALALGLPGALIAQVKAPEDGIEYFTLQRRVPVDAPPGKIEVIDFFWYNCQHCNAFEPLLQRWAAQLPADVVLRRVPVAFRDEMVPQQRLYFTLEALGKVEELHQKVFAAIHRERKDLTREAGILDWAVSQGLDRETFRELYNSFTVSSRARRASQLQDLYKVEGVPAIGIAGRFYTDGQLAVNMLRALQVTDFLIAEARRTR